MFIFLSLISLELSVCEDVIEEILIPTLSYVKTETSLSQIP